MAGERFLDRLLNIVSGHQRTIVIGRVDTGKSTLIQNIADQIDTYILDTDIGQNDIGPPSVISLGKRVHGRYVPVDGYFCGSASPSRHFMQMIAGVSHLIQSCDKRVLINTTGLATGAIGRALKTEKINATRADLIIGLATADELNYLYAFAHAGSEVVIFRPHPQVTSRSKAQRAETRKAAFRSHFKGASVQTYRLDRIYIERLLLNNGITADPVRLQAIDPGIVHAESIGDEALIISTDRLNEPGKVAEYLQVKMIYEFRPADFCGALTGMLGANGKLLGLGIIDSIDFQSGEVSVFSTVDRFSVMQFGSMKLDKTDFSYAGMFGPETLRP